MALRVGTLGGHSAPIWRMISDLSGCSMTMPCSVMMYRWPPGPGLSVSRRPRKSGWRKLTLAASTRRTWPRASNTGCVTTTMGMPEMLPCSGSEMTERFCCKVCVKYGRSLTVVPARGLTGPMTASTLPSRPTSPAVKNSLPSTVWADRRRCRPAGSSQSRADMLSAITRSTLRLEASSSSMNTAALASEAYCCWPVTPRMSRSATARVASASSATAPSTSRKTTTLMRAFRLAGRLLPMLLRSLVLMESGVRDFLALRPCYRRRQSWRVRRQAKNNIALRYDTKLSIRMGNTGRLTTGSHAPASGGTTGRPSPPAPVAGYRASVPAPAALRRGPTRP